MARVLLIARCEIFRETMEYCLPKLGHSAITAADESQARALAVGQAIDLILLDADLPVGPDLAMCASLQRDARLAGIPIVVLTALTPPEMAARVRAAGAAGLLAKPFRWDVLLRLIERVAVDRAQAGPPAFPDCVQS